MAAIPEQQTSLWVDSPGKGAKVFLNHDVPVPTPGDKELLVKIECSGLCHSDIYNINGSHPMDVHVPGHEGVGTIVRLGERVAQAASTLRLGQRVGVKWIHETCGTCDICERDETSCPNQHNSGRDRPGTLQQFVVVPARNATPIPDGISSAAAAPLLCAGLTMYSAIGKSRTRQGDWIVIQGAGGGLGHIGVQVAARRGLRVIAIDAEDKRAFCQEIGASAFFDFRDQDLERKIMDLTSSLGAHAVVCCAGSEAGYNQASKLLRRGGTLVCVGLPSDTSYCLPIGPMDMVVRGLCVIGSSVGTEDEMQELLQLASQGEVVPQVEVLPLECFQEAIEAVRTSRAPGKLVLTMP
ncbi:Polyketide synthase, enoylreductase [Pleurostoma richardsiae]|uniref:Polyketide synthase, enoylreductase n=1 Tax=Pleurostoma richardsiae TaxID=41990 RepID=A0AA38VPN4_9PEZI|nr:Polyketide synthase, enoylreductase [Pleurostoma richardsiae]